MPQSSHPCKNGEWIVLDGSSGNGVCSPSFVCMLGEMPMLDPAGGASCGCADGKEKILGACQTLFTQSVCNEGEVLLPNNFNIGEPICPDNFSCKPIQNCPAYKGRKSEYGLRGSNIRKEQIQFMKDMVCSKASRTICCKKREKPSFVYSRKSVHSRKLDRSNERTKGNMCKESMFYRKIPLSWSRWYCKMFIS